MSIAIFYQENVGLGIFYSQQFTGERINSNGVVLPPVKKQMWREIRSFSNHSWRRTWLKKKFVSISWHQWHDRGDLPFLLCFLSQSFLLAYLSSSSLSCCGATTHWQYLLTLLGFYISPLSYCPGFSCLQLIDCLINYAAIQMQDHACAISMGRQKSTQKHSFACEDACGCMDTFALPIQLMELWLPPGREQGRFAALQVWAAFR